MQDTRIITKYSVSLLAIIGLGLATTMMPSHWRGVSTEEYSRPVLPDATGEQALRHLRESGEFESLGAALTAARYAAEESDGGATATNYENRMTSAISPSGLTLESNDNDAEWLTRWRLSEIAHGPENFTIGDGEVETEGELVTIRRTVAGRRIEEWFRNSTGGLEHGFTIPERLTSAAEDLRLTITIDGDLTAAADSDGQKLRLLDHRGVAILNYDKLRVWDNEGVELPSRMTTSADRLILEVEDATAKYPLTIDPTFSATSELKPVEFFPDYNRFGKSVAISGDTVIVGSPEDDIGNDSNQGSAYIFVRGSNGLWTQQAKLFDPNGAAADQMGYSVSITGDTAVIGCPLSTVGANSDQGAVYVYLRTAGEWTLQQKLTANDGSAGDNLGTSVDVSGDIVIAGSTDFGGPTSAGAALVFVRSGGVWSQQQKLIASDGAQGDSFGISVALAGTNAIVGASFDNVNGFSQYGSAYIFTRTGTTWTQQAKLIAPDGGADEYFGSTVDMATGFQTAATAIIGVYGDDIDGRLQQGSAYVFTRSGTTWSLQQKLTASDGVAKDFFGESVAIAGGTVIVGALILGEAGEPVPLRGAAYVFTRSGGTQWHQRQKLTEREVGATNQFGRAVAINGGTALIGAEGNDAAYILRTGGKAFDFDDDGKTDIGIFRSTVGEWWYQRSSDGQVPAFQFGASTDVIVPADYTGDAKTDIAVWRPSSGEWYVLRSEDNSFFSFPFGSAGDTPIPADFDDDNRADPAIFRPSNSTWYIARSTGGTTIQQFGASGDRPVVGDYDADGRSDIAIYRPSSGQWWINRSASGVLAVTFGVSSDRPVQGDYTGDGKTDVALWRSQVGQWFILRSEDFSYYSISFGAFGDLPAPGDYDGDGKFDATVFRPSNSTWYSQRTTAGTLIQQFGANGDLPIASAFVP